MVHSNKDLVLILFITAPYHRHPQIELSYTITTYNQKSEESDLTQPSTFII